MTDMYRVALKIEYDGRAYAGFQLQPNVTTIQGELEKSIFQLYGESIRIIGSGRTDAGVHAEYQIIHFDTQKYYSESTISNAINYRLKKDIRVLASAYVDNDFHARYSATQRHYTYSVFQGQTALKRNYVWQIPMKLDVETMNKAAKRLLGEHDFTSFCSMQAEVDHKFCTIFESNWIQQQTHFRFNITANRFLHSMVRSLVGTLVEVGKGKLSVKEFVLIFKSQDRQSGAITAPPQGLVLKYVDYDKNIFWKYIA